MQLKSWPNLVMQLKAWLFYLGLQISTIPLVSQNISTESLSLAALHQHIITILGMIAQLIKNKKNLKKQFYFIPTICDYLWNLLLWML